MVIYRLGLPYYKEFDNFLFANLPFERGENPFLKGLFLFIRIFANYKIKPKLHIL